MLTFSTKIDKAFISTGCDNWKKAKGQFRSHQSSQVHHEAILKLSSSERILQVETGGQKDQVKRQQMLYNRCFSHL